MQSVVALQKFPLVINLDIGGVLGATKNDVVAVGKDQRKLGEELKVQDGSYGQLSSVLRRADQRSRA